MAVTVTVLGVALGTGLLWREKNRTQAAYEAEAKATATAVEQRERRQRPVTGSHARPWTG